MANTALEAYLDVLRTDYARPPSRKKRKLKPKHDEATHRKCLELMSIIEEEIQKAQEEREEERRKNYQLLEQLEAEKTEETSKLQLAIAARDAALADSQRVGHEICELQQQLESTNAALQDQVPWNDIQLVLDQAHGDMVSTTTRFWDTIDALQNRRLASYLPGSGVIHADWAEQSGPATQGHDVLLSLVAPKDHVKSLGVLMDAKLKYKEHIARAASKGLEAVMELRRLRGLSPATARQLFTSTVAPVVDYASNVWMHACKDKAMGPINRVQRVGAQAIVGTFLTVATSVAEAEAHLATVQHRFWRRAVKMWTDIHTLPETNPLRRNTARIKKFRRYHRSPLYQVADALKNIEMETLETINPSTLAPWEARAQAGVEATPQSPTVPGGLMQIATSSSARNELVGFGVAIERQPPRYRKLKLKTLSVTLGARAEQNPFSAELAAMAHALNMVVGLKDYRITLLTSNKAAALTLRNPRQQSGQEFVCELYKLMRKLRRNGNQINIRWISTSEDNKLRGLAKGQARAATQEDALPQERVPRMKSTTLNIARSQAVPSNDLPVNVGRHAKRVDAATPRQTHPAAV